MSQALSLGVLDQFPVFHGSAPKTAIRESLQLAAAVEQLHYNRFWVAEHHGDPSLALRLACCFAWCHCRKDQCHTNWGKVRPPALCKPLASGRRLSHASSVGSGTYRP